MIYWYALCWQIVFHEIIGWRKYIEFYLQPRPLLEGSYYCIAPTNAPWHGLEHVHTSRYDLLTTPRRNNFSALLASYKLKPYTVWPYFQKVNYKVIYCPRSESNRARNRARKHLGSPVPVRKRCWNIFPAFLIFFSQERKTNALFYFEVMLVLFKKKQVLYLPLKLC